MYTGMSYRNCFENNCPVTINSMFNECSAVHLHSNALQVIRACGAATRIIFARIIFLLISRFRL